MDFLYQFNLRLHHFPQFPFNVKKKNLNYKKSGLWLVGEVVTNNHHDHVGIYGSKVAEGCSAFQRRFCIMLPFTPVILRLDMSSDAYLYALSASWSAIQTFLSYFCYDMCISLTQSCLILQQWQYVWRRWEMHSKMAKSGKCKFNP